MTKLIAWLIVWSSVCLGPSTGVAHEVDSPIGRWTTFDDRTHAPSGIIRIFEQDGKMFGRIERVADDDGDSPSYCHHCPDDRKDKPVNGLVIIRNMHRAANDPRAWEGGDVLDPGSGKLYRLTMHLDAQGANLIVHGYLGVSLLGRSQTWARASD